MQLPPRTGRRKAELPGALVCPTCNDRVSTAGVEGTWDALYRRRDRGRLVRIARWPAKDPEAL
jgi:hypothetical protein